MHSLYPLCTRNISQAIVVFVNRGVRKQKNTQKPSGEQIVDSSPDVASQLRADLKQLNTQKKNIIEKIQEIDQQMKELTKEVSKKVGKMMIS